MTTPCPHCRGTGIVARLRSLERSCFVRLSNGTKAASSTTPCIMLFNRLCPVIGEIIDSPCPVCKPLEANSANN